MSYVAPHAGAWIETYARANANYVQGVAPHAGAWIETSQVIKAGVTTGVAPHAGAWIETYYRYQVANYYRSLPTRERGLKLYKINNQNNK